MESVSGETYLISVLEAFVLLLEELGLIALSHWLLIRRGRVVLQGDVSQPDLDLGVGLLQSHVVLG